MNENIRELIFELDIELNKLSSIRSVLFVFSAKAESGIQYNDTIEIEAIQGLIQLFEHNYEKVSDIRYKIFEEMRKEV